MIETTQEIIKSGKTILGIELGSTRIKGVLLNPNYEIIASGEHSWENKYVDGIWTYNLNDIWHGVQESYKNMTENIREKYNVELTNIASIGFSAMMHGYLVFDKNNNLLVPFRTWRNNFTQEASEKLMKIFNYPIPQRWSIAHLYQGILNKEEHVEHIDYMTTLAGYVHWKLSGEKVLGIGDASGMFPIDLSNGSYNKKMLEQFDELVTDENFSWKLENILPKILKAGENAGFLSEEGAKLLDPSGKLQSGSLMCPPEGDAGTGMVATNSVSSGTGNVSAGTSVFAMIVLDGELKKVYSELDLVTSPTGKLVAMAHSNNCSSNLDSWIGIFKEINKEFLIDIDDNTLYSKLYNKALEGDKDCGGLLSYGYLSGEHITHFEEGRPLFARTANSNFNLANFMRVNLQSALGAMKIGIDILLKEEGVKLDKMLGHGGFFKTEGVGQRFMSAAVNAPVSIMKNAGEGGAWGIAILAAYMLNRKQNESLEDFLNKYIFNNQEEISIMADKEDVIGFEKFMERYKKGLNIERSAIEFLK